MFLSKDSSKTTKRISKRKPRHESCSVLSPSVSYSGAGSQFYYGPPPHPGPAHAHQNSNTQQCTTQPRAGLPQKNFHSQETPVAILYLNDCLPCPVTVCQSQLIAAEFSSSLLESTRLPSRPNRRYKRKLERQRPLTPDNYFSFISLEPTRELFKNKKKVLPKEEFLKSNSVNEASGQKECRSHFMKSRYQNCEEEKEANKAHKSSPAGNKEANAGYIFIDLDN